MKITKEYKFYAGHRNQLLNDKCARPHGHDYKIFITFDVIRNGDITTLFDEFDRVFEPYFKNEIDHRFLIDQNDPLLSYFRQYEQDHNADLGLKVLPHATSVENMCFHIFDYGITQGFKVNEVKIQETRTSAISYTRYDWELDKALLSV